MGDHCKAHNCSFSLFDSVIHIVDFFKWINNGARYDLSWICFKIVQEDHYISSSWVLASHYSHNQQSGVPLSRGSLSLWSSCKSPLKSFFFLIVHQLVFRKIEWIVQYGRLSVWLPQWSKFNTSKIPSNLKTANILMLRMNYCCSLIIIGTTLTFDNNLFLGGG